MAAKAQHGEPQVHENREGGRTIRQTTKQGAHAAPLPAESANQSPRGLWKEVDAARYFGVSVRKFALMRAAGQVPAPVVLGPRALRWIPSECEDAARNLPRARLQEPAQLARARIERMKAGAAAPGAGA